MVNVSVLKRRIEKTANKPKPTPRLYSAFVKTRHMKNVQMLINPKRGCSLMFRFLLEK